MDEERSSAAPAAPGLSARDQRIADLSTFSSGLVHDLRNPLNVIRTNVYLLRQRLAEGEPKITRAIDRIDDQVTVAMRLLDSVQSFYRADAPTMQRVSLNALVENVVASGPLPESFRLECHLHPDLPLLSADPQLIEAALRAVLRNSLQAMPEGGAVAIVTDRSDGRVRLAVQDAGPGIPSEVRPRVFEPFFTTHRGRSGLGLALVERVARAHGGEARVEPSPAGTRVVLDLPVPAGG
jgi:signal transduction histidine kinase